MTPNCFRLPVLLSARSPFLFNILVLVVWMAGASGQQGAAQPMRSDTKMLKGMVWTAPADVDRAEVDLIRMRDMGVQTVRTSLLQEERLLTLADTLGLHLFQEVPLDYLSAPELADTLAYAMRVLALALDQARGHPSARHFGLARRSDTSNPRACAFFEQLAGQVRRQPGSQVYYLSAFIEADQCAEAVDLVLLDARDVAAPESLLVRWQTVHPDTPVGLSGVGTWVSARAEPGLRHPHSSASQARYLETHLRTLLTGASPTVLFVYRWRDVEADRPSVRYDMDRPYQPGFGLWTKEDVPRPSADVVQGFYTGEQTVFAFPAGAEPTPPTPWNVLIGWLVVILVTVCYAVSPRFRHMVPRYFQARGFYREGIREGRDVLLGASVLLLVALALGVGVLGSSLLGGVRAEPALQLLFQKLPLQMQETGVALLTKPWLLVLLLGSLYALSVALWTSVLSVLSRRRQQLVPGQALMLVLWVRWPFLVLMIGAMVVPALPDALARYVLAGLAAAALLVSIYAFFRTLIDYSAITYVSAYQVLLAGLLNPIVIIVLLLLLLALDLRSVLTFAYHLATKS
ncbi:MAG TPA: hypothetical protein VKP65_24920 [Rhodothermales bacterium]|nr:hypothetical protein [Rhodothermales bacterium]